jgi:hypothetical protein
MFINISDFWESNKLVVVFLLFAGFWLINSIRARVRSNELKKNIFVTKNSLLIGDHIRVSKSDLSLDVYKGSPTGFHLYDSESKFTLFTNEYDDLIAQLLEENLLKEEFSLKSYAFIRPNKVLIKTDKGRQLHFNLDTGEYTIKIGEIEVIDTKKPRYFIQVPGFERVS